MLALTATLGASACGRGRGDRAAQRRPDVAASDEMGPTNTRRAPSPAPTPRAARPPPNAEMGDACAVARGGVQVARGWSVVGLRPGPAFRELATHDRHRLLGVTARRVCSSDDNGETWAERLVVPSEAAGLSLALSRIDRRGTWLLVARRAREPGSEATDGVIVATYLSRDGAAERWESLPQARAGQLPAEVFTDGAGRIYFATATELFESADFGASWAAPRTLPGLEAREVDACGLVLIARARVDQDWFYHRSFDHGLTWRPFRLGPIGLEGPSALVRCIGGHGGVEAGRAPLPSHWSWDGGHTWSPAGYDASARRVATRLTADDPGRDAHDGRDARGPACEQVADGEIGCMDPGRLRLVHPGRSVVQEVRAPASCSHVRQTDPEHTYAFGGGCGLYVSTDRGGVWRMLSQSTAERAPGAFVDGRGGFIDARTAWRLDGGVWWTFDAGEHWRPYVDVSERVLDRGVFVDTLHGVFATAGGWVLATRDGGRNWTYVLRGEVERIASAGRAVVVTTTQTVRVTPNGGVTWLAAGGMSPQQAFDPSVELLGSRRVMVLGHGARLAEDHGRIALEHDGLDEEIVRGLPAGYHLLGARASGGQPERLLLEGGVVLVRESTGERTRARAGTSGGGRGHRNGRHRRHG